MKALVRPPIQLAFLGLLVGLLIVAPAGQARAQANSAGAPSFGAENAKTPSGDEAGKPADTGNAATHHKGAHSQHKKKKTSFMSKMRDKAQKLFGKKQEPQPAAKQIPQKDIE